MASFVRKSAETSTARQLPEALAFINLSIPSNTPSGAKKIGTIVLNAGDEDHEHLFEKMAANPDLAVKFVKNLIVEFRLNQKAEPMDAKKLDALFK